MKTSKSKEEFINSMKKSGYQVEWSDNKKNVVFILDPKILKGKKDKFRLSNLQKTFNIPDFTKEKLLEIFKINKEKELDNIFDKMNFADEKKSQETNTNVNQFSYINKNNDLER